jgi:predicted small lipoprotein YifL
VRSLIVQALLALALAIAAAACGDSGHLKLPDGGTMPMPDAPTDGPPVQETLTQYVIDLVQNHTANNTAARPYGDFQTLPDPDGSNGSAYSPLFP